MDFAFSPQEEAFRSQVRAWLAENLPPELTEDRYDDAYPGEGRWDAVFDFSRRFAKQGWLAVAWPKEYGGLGASYAEQYILSEEVSYAGAPVNINVNRIGYTGPTIMVYGTDEQKAQHLPGIISGEVMWAQGFSEPGAGSDLAALQTRAVREGDYYIVNGQKIWTSYAHHSDWMILLVRTDPDAPKHRGITYLLADMHTPGLQVRPLPNMYGAHHFNEVFFDNVRVPVTNRIGEENRGWYAATTTLDFERSSVANSAISRRHLDTLCRTFRDGRATGGDDRQREATRLALAELAVEVNVGRWLSYRVVSMQARGLVPNMEASMAKLYNSELLQHIGRAGIRAFGMRGQVAEGPYAVDGGRWDRYYQESTARTIGGGTSEVQRNIVATRGLGLPR